MLGEIGGVVSALSTALKIAKDVNEAGKALDQSELKLKMAELMVSLADARIAAASADAALRDKDAEIARLLSAIKERDTATVDHEGLLYRKRSDDGKPQGLPYCPKCRSSGTLQLTMRSMKAGRPVDCPICSASFQADTFAPEHG